MKDENYPKSRNDQLGFSFFIPHPSTPLSPFDSAVTLRLRSPFDSAHPSTPLRMTAALV